MCDTSVFINLGTVALLRQELETKLTLWTYLILIKVLMLKFNSILVINFYFLPRGVNPHDIALLKLQKHLDFTQAVQPIKISENKDFKGFATLSGWGVTSNFQHNPLPNQLQTTNVSLLNYEDCKQHLEKLTGNAKPLISSNICSGETSKHSYSSACSGDSGGPLIQNGELIGIVSWGLTPCGVDGAPVIYVKLYDYLDFINEHLQFFRIYDI